MNVMRARPFLLVAAAALLAVAPSSPAGAADRREGEPFHWSGRLAAGRSLGIEGVNGRIRVEPATGAEVTVDAEKWATRGDPERVKIEVQEDGDGVRIRARHPKGWLGSNSGVDFTVRVPAGVNLDLATVNGTVLAEGLDNRVAARTVNGSVRIDTRGEAEARTVNGSITARARPRSGDLSFRTVNGSVRLELPADVGARVSGRTINGSIHSDFPMRVRGGWVGRSLRGTLGDGGADLEIRTVNGSIQLRRI